MTRLNFGNKWSLKVGTKGKFVTLWVRTPTRNEDPIPFCMAPEAARSLGVALVAHARAIDQESAEHARLIAEAEADIEAMPNGTDRPVQGITDVNNDE